MIRIAVDVYGGDNAPGCVIDGAVEALEMLPDVSIVFFGAQAEVEKLLAEKTYDKARVSVVDAPGVITNHDSPTLAIRRKLDSSLVRAMDAVKKGEADALVTAGSTGATLAGGIFRVGRIKGIDRPALCPVLPTAGDKPVMLVDCGANAECKPEYLVQFALMGQAYMKGVMGIEDPKVGLLNIGAEDEKGDTLRKSAFPLLKENDKINFYGNVEARDALTGCVQVIVCDGFSGNILLKSTEGAVQLLFGKLKEGLYSSTRAKVGALLVKPALKGVKNQLDYEQYGGAALLGVTGALVKAHGSSKAHAFACAIRQARSMVEGNVVGIIAQQLKSETADA
ncbi:MAG: phosphate acyltransferase PlsX [Candidatus Spyradocola sp.]|nr:phosphate acyltransferase PlsX [Candidatus Spyradocola sp.]